ncbi:MAG: hypothetical protein DI617_03190 [Streptococcus pyogenes]|nr:MAG: hypothetical protein DI617_03190 [Streptococcus pyogenes]
MPVFHPANFKILKKFVKNFFDLLVIFLMYLLVGLILAKSTGKWLSCSGILWSFFRALVEKFGSKALLASPNRLLALL